jgi:hypothetical protein
MKKEPRRLQGPENKVLSCKLFGDKVTEHLCALRKAELHPKEGFSCEGCIRNGDMTGGSGRGHCPGPMKKS